MTLSARVICTIVDWSSFWIARFEIRGGVEARTEMGIPFFKICTNQKHNKLKKTHTLTTISVTYRRMVERLAAGSQYGWLSPAIATLNRSLIGQIKR
jgi:hypothetical protein